MSMVLNAYINNDFKQFEIVTIFTTEFSSMLHKVFNIVLVSVPVEAMKQNISVLILFQNNYYILN